jgi:tripartite-type tricarboxylate transporter receptor subunit TctC
LGQGYDWAVELGRTAKALLVAALLGLLSACGPASPAAPATPAPTGAPAAPTFAPTVASTVGPQTGAVADRQAVGDFYRGKTIRLIVGFSPGGGFDTYSRLIARHLADHTPGNPTVVVENMPGAGSLVAANWLYNVAPKDGTVMANFNGQLFIQRLLGAAAVQFDLEQFEYLGVPVADNLICVASGQSGFKGFADAQKPNGRQIVLGAGAPGDTTTDTANVLAAALNLNVRLVGGYPGTADIRNAMERGEVDGMCGWSWESARVTNLEDIQSGKIVVLTQVTEETLPGLPGPSVPMARDLAADQDARDLVHSGLFLPSRVVRPYVLPPGTPKDRVAALRAAVADTFSDPALLAEADKAKLSLAPVPGERVLDILHEVQKMPPQVQERLKSILVTGG